MLSKHCAALILALLLCHGYSASAADPRLTVTVSPTTLPDSHKLESGHYLTAREALAAVTELQRVLLIDVRTHEETLFNGIATPMHRHIPYVIPDLDHSYDAGAQRYRLEPNPDFVKAVGNLLAEMKLDRSATVIVYCSVGERSAKAASVLARSGYPNAYSMVEGFDGDPSSRVGPGWKASGLPWTLLMKPSQAYKSPSM